MCTYCGTDKYRKIYENHIGPIPYEKDGRSYEIHHLDGDHSNNIPSNLKAVTLQEHYNLHYEQGDYGACYLMAVQKLNKSPEEISSLASMNACKRVEEGNHHFLGGAIQSKMNIKRVQNGTHPFLGGSVQSKSNQERLLNGTHHMVQEDNPSKQRVEKGTHNFLTRDDGSSLSSDRVKAGTHNFKKEWFCSVCNRGGKGTGNFAKYHGNCLTK